MPLPNTKERYSYQDYITWDDDERWEIIDGVAYNMAPAPKLDHQDVTGNFYTFLNVHLKGKRCKPFIAPTDVILSEHDVVQPDVLVVCDPKKYENGKNIQGAPNLVIEVLSPSTENKDRTVKKAQCAKFGVAEYLIADIDKQIVEQYVLQPDGNYNYIAGYEPDQSIPLQSLEGIYIPLTEIF